MKRIIAHIDLDAFFASVEEREKPYLKGAPIIVGADPLGGKGRGVAATASYSARKYGITSATPISKAWRLCQEAKQRGGASCVFITPRYGKYEKASQEVFSLVRKQVSRIEQVSIDEAYVDFSEAGSYTKAGELGEAIKNVVLKRLSLPLTIGIGPNKLAAKIASEAGKPNGLCIMSPRIFERHLVTLTLKDIPGIGWKSVERFKSKGISTIKEARSLSWQELRRLFGVQGFTLYERLRGIDERTIETEDAPPLSIGKMHTFDTDVKTIKSVQLEVERQAARIIQKLKEYDYTGFHTVALTIRFSDFETVTRHISFREHKIAVLDLELAGLKLLLPFFESKENPHKKAIRLVGLRIEKLV